ncbi:MAG TPA: CHRD domain-containing protein [Gammaproteobacteria bacterium]
MKKNLARCGGAAVVAACAVLLAPLAAAGEEATFHVTLSGPEASGDPDGRGEATVTLNAETNQVEVRLTYSNIAEPTAIFIRRGATGLEGNIAVPVVIESRQGNTIIGRRTSAMPNAVARILASPEEHYLVVMNEEYPVNALRGPLRKE